MDLALVVEALCAVERGAPARPLPPSEAIDFLDEAIHFRRAVAYAAARLTAQLTRHESALVRARAVTALAAFVDLYPREVEALLLERAGDRAGAVREASTETLALLLAHLPDRDALAERWRSSSREAAHLLRNARRLQPG